MYEPHDVDRFRDAILESHARLVIIDASADIMPGGDENSVQDTQPIFHCLRAIAEEAQCAIIVIHHSNRNGQYRGSSALKGAVDLMLMIHSEKNSDGVKEVLTCGPIEAILSYAIRVKHYSPCRIWLTCFTSSGVNTQSAALALGFSRN